MTNNYTEARRKANALMTYANQIDPLVSANEAALDVWTYRLANVNENQARQVIVEYYANQRAAEKTPITPREVHRQVEQRRRQAIGAGYYCQQHDGEPADRCKQCVTEVHDGERLPRQIGRDIRKLVPPPPALKQTRQAIGAALKDINEGSHRT